MRRVEIRDAINTTTSLVNHELPMPIFPCRLNNPRIPIGPVVIARVISRTRSPSRSTRMREPSCLISMKPLWPGRNLGCIGRQAELERPKHATKICIRSGFAKADKHSPAIP